MAGWGTVTGGDILGKLLDALFGRDLTASASELAAAQVPASAPAPSLSMASPWQTTTMARILLGAELADTITIDRSTAMSVGAIAKGRHVITSLIASFPLYAYRGTQRLPLEQQPALCRQLEPGRPMHTSLVWLVDALLFYGRAWLITVDRETPANGGRPRRLRWVPEWEAEVDAFGSLVRAFGATVPAGDVVRIDGPHEGLLNFARPRIREAIAMDIAAANAADNPVPSIELHQTGGTPLTNEQIDSLTARWNSRRRFGGAAYTNESIEARVHGQAAEQLLIDGRNVAALNLARAMGLPAWAVDASVDGSSMTYSNSPSRSRELIDYGLAGYLNAIEARLSMDDLLPAGTRVLFDTSQLLRGNFLERMQAGEVAIRAGIYTAQELRQIEEGNPAE